MDFAFRIFLKNIRFSPFHLTCLQSKSTIVSHWKPLATWWSLTGAPCVAFSSDSFFCAAARMLFLIFKSLLETVIVGIFGIQSSGPGIPALSGSVSGPDSPPLPHVALSTPAIPNSARSPPPSHILTLCTCPLYQADFVFNGFHTLCLHLPSPSSPPSGVLLRTATARLDVPAPCFHSIHHTPALTCLLPQLAHQPDYQLPEGMNGTLLLQHSNSGCCWGLHRFLPIS